MHSYILYFKSLFINTGVSTDILGIDQEMVHLMTENIYQWAYMRSQIRIHIKYYNLNMILNIIILIC